ncbi:N-6 DNA methylase [Halopolyspora algeriensis]|uniref:N-6 DNA methylase n=1 Tax=Halopolyspora algeriensis TaxID=1500506 RepID=A0A368VVJ1_9ACTN|nr:N-6 DNA methylase [Halopolyspora algeriensis]TQM55274.1 N-6 DNA methylase [Halopolyspora algeriensis]
MNVVNTHLWCATVFGVTEHEGAPAGSGATINAVDIARLAGVGRAAVSNWRKRYADFPEPVAGTTSSPLFDAEQARAWLREQGKLRELPLREELWRALDVLRGSTPPGAALALFAVGLCYLRSRGGKLTEELGDEVLADDASLVEAVRERIATMRPEQVPIELPTPDRTWATLLRLLDRVADEPDVFDELVPSAVEGSARHGGSWRIPPELAELMYRLAGGTTVLDPHCHAGELLRPALRNGSEGALVAGQYPDRQAVQLVRAALWLHSEDVPRIEVGDALRADAFPGETFGSVLCVPPWGGKDWGFEELQFDPRWEYGLPPRSAPELAWVQHALSHLEREGVAVLALPVAVGTQARGRRIRAELVRRGVLRAVIALPAGAFTTSSALTVLWVLRSSAATQPGGILMADGSRARAARGPDWRAVSDLVLPAWREFDSTGECAEQPGELRVVPAIDLLDDEVNLTPARHLASAPETDVDGIRTTRDRLLDVLGQVPQHVPEVTARTEPPAPSTTVNELARIGALTLLQQSGSGSREEQEGLFTALTSRDVIQGGAPSGSWGGSGTREPVWLQPGDVVLPMLGGQLTSRVIGDEQAVLGTHLWLLRPNPEQLDPWFLAGFLRNSANATLSSGSSMSRLDVRRVELPRLPLAEQRAYAAAFQQLFRLEHGLSQAAQHGSELITAMIDGLTGNGLQPPEEAGQDGDAFGASGSARE